MSYLVCIEDSSTEGVIIVRKSWMVPGKLNECFWPTFRTNSKLNKCLIENAIPDSKLWMIIKISKILYETDDIIKARTKAKQAEVTSDIVTTSDDEEIIGRKRKIVPPIRYTDELSDEGSEVGVPLLNVFVRSNDNVSVDKERGYKVDSALNQENNSQGGLDSQLRKSTSSGGYHSQYSPSTSPEGSLHRQSTSSGGYHSQYSQSTSPVDSRCRQSTSSGGSLSQHNQHTASQPPQKLLTAFEDRVLRDLATVKEQNKQLMQWMSIQDANNGKVCRSPLPVNLPIADADEFIELEKYLSENTNFSEFCSYIKWFCGKSSTAAVNGMLRASLSNNFAVLYSYKGVKAKKAFCETHLNSAIIRVAEQEVKGVKRCDIEDKIKVWLKGAPQRIALKNLRSTHQ